MKKKISAILCAVMVTAGMAGYPAYASSVPSVSNASSDASEKSEIPSGEAVSEAEAKEVIGKINEKMASEKRVAFKGSTEIETMGTVSTSEMSGSYDIENNMSKIVVDFMGNNMETYTADGKTYVMDPTQGEWLSAEIPGGTSIKDSFTIKDGAESLLSVEKLSDGFVLKSKKSLSKEELSEVLSSNTVDESFGEMAAKLEVSADIAIVVDSEYRYKTYITDMKINSPELAQEMRVKGKTEYMNYGDTEDIVLPEEAKNAKPLEMNPSSNTQQ